MCRMKKFNLTIRCESIPDGKLEKYILEDENSNQQLDWTDDFQRYCARHDRNFHIKCRSCHLAFKPTLHYPEK